MWQKNQYMCVITNFCFYCPFNIVCRNIEKYYFKKIKVLFSFKILLETVTAGFNLSLYSTYLANTEEYKDGISMLKVEINTGK